MSVLSPAAEEQNSDGRHYKITHQHNRAHDERQAKGFRRQRDFALRALRS